MLAPVELQLMLHFLDFRGRLCAARCCRQIYAAASHSFAWPQEAEEQLLTLRVPNDNAALQALGAQVRSSLLRLSAIDIRLRQTTWILGPEVFAVPHVHAIRAPHTAGRFRWNLPNSFLSLLCHPQAPQLRSLDISNLGDHQCSPAELQQLASLPHLHSLSLAGALRSELDSNINAALHRLSLFPSLTHLSINVSNEEPQDYASLWECTRLNSLGLQFATVQHGVGPLSGSIAAAAALATYMLLGGRTQGASVGCIAFAVRNPTEWQMRTRAAAALAGCDSHASSAALPLALSEGCSAAVFAGFLHW